MNNKSKNLFCSTYNPCSNNGAIDSMLYSLNRRDNSFDFIITPRNRIINLELEMNPSESNKWSIEAIEPYCVRKEDLEKVFQKEERKEEDKMRDGNRILNIYEDIESKKINQCYDAKIGEIEKESAETKIAEKAKEFALKELKKVFPDYDENRERLILVTHEFKEETQTKINDLNKERRKELIALDEKITEIRAVMEIAETFEQKMDILKAYNVVDKKGVIIK
jgi:hypothetical protein